MAIRDYIVTLRNCRSIQQRRRRQRIGFFRPLLEQLEGRRMLAAAFAEFIDPNPNPGNQFGQSVVPLSTGNVVITSPFDDAGGTDAGAVYLFNGATGDLISTLTGSSDIDNIGLNAGGFGGVTALTNGNFVVSSLNWDLDATNTNVGAVTFGNGTTGISGVISVANSLIGSRTNDMSSGALVTPLTSGNYAVRNTRWDLNASTEDVGAVSFGDGTTGVSGAISAVNSLIGSTSFDRVGSTVTALSNGNYVVTSSIWNVPGGTLEVGAVTFANGTTGITGSVSTGNSLTGSRASDRVGSDGVTALPNGNYLVRSSDWDLDATKTDVGAVTFGNGSVGSTGAVSTANSLVGSSIGDSVGLAANGGIRILSNGNYVVGSGFWSLDATHTQVGAVTFGNATTGVVGPISAANSLVGSTSDDFVGSAGVVALTNGNYVVVSNVWDLDATHTNVGAITWGNGTTGVKGAVSAANSLVGSTTDDALGFNGSGGVVALTNGNYVVYSPLWDLDATTTDVGAATFGNGTTGISGAVTSANSLTGSKSNDKVSANGRVLPLSNGNYVVRSGDWNLDATTTRAGAVTFANGTTGIVGVVSSANSLVGSTIDQRVGNNAAALTNGNYVVANTGFDFDATTKDIGAIVLGSGTTGITGTVSSGGSLTGSTHLDNVGSGNVTALMNGNYVVSSPLWDLNPATTNVGAVTFGNGALGTNGVVSSVNSLVGSKTTDSVGTSGTVTPLPNGNFVVRSALWDNGALVNAGAVTFGHGTTGVVGPITTANSAIGEAASSSLQTVVLDDVNGNFFAIFLAEGGGRVRVGSQVDGFAESGMTLGNQIWIDGNGNSTYEMGQDFVLSNIAITLFQGNGTTVVDTTTTDSLGRYEFTDLLPGDYIVRVDAANFGVSGPLNGARSLPGALDPDTNINHDDNGVDNANPATNGIRSLAITLAFGTEPFGAGNNTNFSLDFGFSSVPTPILNPIGAATGVQPTLSWQPVPGAARYEVWFSRRYPNALRLYLDSNVTTNMWTVPSALAPAFYRYWVRALDANSHSSPWSSFQGFQVRPTLVSPLAGTFTNPPTFQWSPIPFASSYELFLETTAGSQMIPMIAGTSYTPSSPLPMGDVQWWIRATGAPDGAGWSLAGNANSTPRAFVTGPASSASTTPTFTWTLVPGAGKYILHVELLGNPGFAVIRQENLVTTQFTPAAPLAPGAYRAWVKAINGATNSFATAQWSNAFDFTVVAAEPDSVTPENLVGDAILVSVPRLLLPVTELHFRHHASSNEGNERATVPLNAAVTDAEADAPILNLASPVTLVTQSPPSSGNVWEELAPWLLDAVMEQPKLLAEMLN